MDIYAIQRAFKYKNSKLNIVYFGNAHIANIKKFLVEYSKMYNVEYEKDDYVNCQPTDKTEVENINRCISINKPTFIDLNIIDVKDISKRVLMDETNLISSIESVCESLKISKNDCLRSLSKNTKRRIGNIFYIDKETNKRKNLYIVFDDSNTTTTIDKIFTSLKKSQIYVLFTP